MESPISLALFTTTKGHFGKTNIYKSTINDLFFQVGVDFFASKVVHIKREEGDEEVFDEMFKFFNLFGFKILSTFGKWKHYDLSHYIEHGKDIITLLSDEDIQKNQFVLWLEDDFLFRSKNELLADLNLAVNILKEDANILNVRWLKNEEDMKLLQINENSLNSDKCYFTHNDVFSFNPSIIRSRDAWYLARMFERFYFQNTHIHIERAATEFLKPIASRKTNIFSAFYLNCARAVHIGEKSYYDGVEKDIKF
jgi:hypothetical protein